MVGSQVDRRSQEAALIADHPHFYAWDLVEVQDQEARLAAVQEAQAVAALLDGLEGPGVAVDHHHIAEELRVPERRDVSIRNERPGDAVEEGARVRVEQRAVRIERAVLDGDRDLVVGLVGRELVVRFRSGTRQHGWVCRMRLSSTAASPSGPPRMM